MKKLFILAAMLLSSAAQAETWVCTTPTGNGLSYLSTFVRTGTEFSRTLTTPETRDRPSSEIKSDPLKVMVENETFLTLAEIDPDGSEVAVYIIHKKTKQYITDSVYFFGDTSRSFGSCVSI